MSNIKKTALELLLAGLFVVGGIKSCRYVVSQSALVKSAEERGRLMSSIGNYSHIEDKEKFMKEYGEVINKDVELMRKVYELK